MAKRDPNFDGSLEDLELQIPGKLSPLRDSSPGLGNNNTGPISVPSYEVTCLIFLEF